MQLALIREEVLRDVVVGPVIGELLQIFVNAKREIVEVERDIGGRRFGLYAARNFIQQLIFDLETKEREVDVLTKRLAFSEKISKAEADYILSVSSEIVAAKNILRRALNFAIGGNVAAVRQNLLEAAKVLSWASQFLRD